MGEGYKTIEEKIRELADTYAAILNKQISSRLAEMETDDKSHYLIYRVLGISTQEGDAIDLYQNKGRFLYKYAGSLLETAAKLCFQERYPESASLRIPNSMGNRPKTFEIDCLVNNEAYEIKWRDATTDGDHITKEHSRLKAIAIHYVPIRLMFYYPNRRQAIRIQSVLEDLYKAVGGSYYYGDAAWNHLKEKTDVDLYRILERIAEERGF